MSTKKKPKHSLTVWYSVGNGGDGSAYPSWFATSELAELDQEFMAEGWGESCTGSFTVSSESPIEFHESISTKETMIKELEEELSYFDEESDDDTEEDIALINEKIEKVKNCK